MLRLEICCMTLQNHLTISIYIITQIAHQLCFLYYLKKSLDYHHAIKLMTQEKYLRRNSGKAY